MSTVYNNVHKALSGVPGTEKRSNILLWLRMLFGESECLASSPGISTYLSKLLKVIFVPQFQFLLLSLPFIRVLGIQ